MRKCPTAHQLFGCRTIWDLSTKQFNWILENLSEEYKPQPKQKSK